MNKLVLSIEDNNDVALDSLVKKIKSSKIVKKISLRDDNLKEIKVIEDKQTIEFLSKSSTNALENFLKSEPDDIF